MQAFVAHTNFAAWCRVLPGQCEYIEKESEGKWE